MTPLAGPVTISLGPPLPAASSGQPGSLGRDHPTTPRLPAGTLPYLALLRVGFALPIPSPGPRCALTAPFHPYPATQPLRAAGEAVCFLWHFPWGRPRSALPTTLPCGARTFLPSRLAAETAATRPSPDQVQTTRPQDHKTYCLTTRPPDHNTAGPRTVAIIVTWEIKFK